jgi:hypothetical protein
MDSLCASERNVSFFDDAHPERLFPPDRRDVRSWQPFFGAGMSFTDLNNEDHFSHCYIMQTKLFCHVSGHFISTGLLRSVDRPW